MHKIFQILATFLLLLYCRLEDIDVLIVFRPMSKRTTRFSIESTGIHENLPVDMLQCWKIEIFSSLGKTSKGKNIFFSKASVLQLGFDFLIGKSERIHDIRPFLSCLEFIERNHRKVIQSLPCLEVVNNTGPWKV